MSARRSDELAHHIRPLQSATQGQIRYMRVYLRRSNARMSEKSLDKTNIDTPFKQ